MMNIYLLQKQVDNAVAAANAQIAKVPNSSAFYLLGTALLSSFRYLGLTNVTKPPTCARVSPGNSMNE